MKRFILAVAVGIGTVAVPLGAAAQPADLPPLADAAPNLSRQVEAPEPAPGPALTNTPGAGPSFQLNGIEIEGATAIERGALAQIWRDFLGTFVTIPTLNGIVAQISALYRERGFLLSQAVLPAQTIQNGIVRIVVIEGFIDDLSVAGGAPNQQALVGRYFEPVQADRPLEITTLERSVLLSRDAVGSALGSSVETILGPSPDTFGAANLNVQITQQPMTGYVSADNRGSRLYGDLNFGSGVRAFNMIGLNETLDVNLAFAPQGASLRFGSVSVEMPVLAFGGGVFDGARLRVAANVFRGEPDLSEAGDTTGLLSISDQTEVSAQLLVPFIRTRSVNLFGRASLTLRDIQTQSGLIGAVVTEDARIVISELGAAWDFADTRGGISFVDVSLRQGLGLAGAEVSATGPAAGELHFTSAQLTATRLQSFAESPWSIFTEFRGQISKGVQPNSERYFLGGASIGRGFAPGNTSGDTGYAVRVELRRVLAPGTWAQAANVFGFMDYGQAYDRSIARDGVQQESLGSVGVGAQIEINDWLSLTPQIVRQIEGTPRDTGDNRRQTRLFFGAVGRF